MQAIEKEEGALSVAEVRKWLESWQLLQKCLARLGSRRQAKDALKHGNIVDHIAHLAGTIQGTPVDTAWMRFCTEALVTFYGEVSRNTLSQTYMIVHPGRGCSEVIRRRVKPAVPL